MMIRNFLLLLTLLMLLQGCASPKDIRYYLLEYVPTIPEQRSKQGPWPWKVRIKEFTIAEAYRRPEMIYRQSPHEMLFYNYEQWAVKPEYLVTDMTYRHLRAAHLFQELTRSIETDEADFVLRGEINALEEYDNENLWYAHLAITLFLENPRDGKVVWMRDWDYRKRVPQQQPVYVVRELSLLLEGIVDEASLSLDSLFQQLPRTPNISTTPDALGAPGNLAPPPSEEMH